MPQALAVEQPVQDPVLQVPRRYPADAVRAFGANVNGLLPIEELQ